MSKRNEFNIGQTNKTSVKVAQGPGGQSSWSLNWGDPSKANQQKKQSSNYMKYHNSSNIVLGQLTPEEQEEERKRLEEEKLKRGGQQLNQKPAPYDPKFGGKSSLHFGDDKPDYRKKDQIFTSVKVKAPPGGKSSIQFG